MRISRTKVEIVGSMESGGGTCLLIKDVSMPPIAIDCGASPGLGRASAHATEKLVRAVVNAKPQFLAVSHFHFDHWGAIPRLFEEMDQKVAPPPMIVSTDMTFSLLQRYIEGWPRSVVPQGIRLIVNKHSVPGSCGILFQGNKTVFYTGDCYSIDLPDSFPEVDLLIVDSTGAMRDNPRPDKEVEIRVNITNLISETLLGNRSSRVYIALFSSQLERAAYLQDEVKRLICAYPLIKGMSLCQNLNAFRGTPRSKPDSRVVLTTGVWAQGETNLLGEDASALVKISNGRDADCELKKGDLVVLSGSIPVWSSALILQIEAMCKRLKSCGARVVVDTSAPQEWTKFVERKEVHASGHGNMPEIAELLRRIKPKMVLPFHASDQARAKIRRYCERQKIPVVSDNSLPVIGLV